MTGNEGKGLLFLEKHWSSAYFWVYIVQLIVWTVVVGDTIDEPLNSSRWLIAYVRETSGAAQLLVLATVIVVNVWRRAVKLFQEKVLSVKEQRAESRAEGIAEGIAEGMVEGRAEGRAEAANAIAAKLRERGGMSEYEIAEIVNGTMKEDVVPNGGVRPEFYEVVARATALAVVEAINQMSSSPRKTEDAGEAEKRESGN